MYGRQPKSLSFSPPKAFDPASYQAHLQARLVELQTFVKLHLATAATAQRLLMALIPLCQTSKLMILCGYPYLRTSCKLGRKLDG